MSVAWSTDQQEQFSCLCIGVIVIKINFYVGLPNLHPQIPQKNNSYWEEPEHLPFPLFPALLAAMISHPVKASTLGTPQLLQLLLDPHLSSTSIFWPSRVVRTHQKSKCVNHIPNSDISQLIQAWDYSISVPGEKKKKMCGLHGCWSPCVAMALYVNFCAWAPVPVLEVTHSLTTRGSSAAGSRWPDTTNRGCFMFTFRVLIVRSWKQENRRASLRFHMPKWKDVKTEIKAKMLQ